MKIQKIDNEQFSKFYQVVEYELEMLEKDLINLEKEFFGLTPHFDKILQRLERVRSESKSNDATILQHRITNLAHEFLRFHHTSGYNVQAFHNLFQILKSIRNKLTDELFSESAVKIIREKVRNEAARWLPDGFSRKSDLRKFLAVQNYDMNFLIPFQKKLWEKRVENKKKLKIQIKSIDGENIFPFKTLPSSAEPSNVKEKLAVLLELQNGEKSGILTDSVEGVMVFSEKFMKKHTDYFPVGDGQFKPFVMLKGKRYFLRDLAI